MSYRTGLAQYSSFVPSKFTSLTKAFFNNDTHLLNNNSLINRHNLLNRIARMNGFCNRRWEFINQIHLPPNPHAWIANIAG